MYLDNRTNPVEGQGHRAVFADSLPLRGRDIYMSVCSTAGVHKKLRADLAEIKVRLGAASR